MPSRARFARRAGAGIAGLIACATLFPANASAAEASVTAGDMDWGYKASWRSYIENVPPAGTITASDGATRSQDGTTFNFPNATGTYDADAGAAAIAYEGTVTFAKPGHGINVVMSDPELTIDGNAGSITADMSNTSGSAEDVEIATLDLSAVTPTTAGDEVTYSAIPAVAAEEGAAYFQYEAGTALDPVSTTFTAEEEAVVENPIIKALSGVRKLDGNKAEVAKVRCPDACEITAPETIVLKSGAKSSDAKVIAPDSLGADETVKVAVRLNGAGRKALAGKTARGAMRIEAFSGPGEASERVAFKVKVPRR